MNDQNRGDILIVDDTPANLQLLMQLLNDQGYKVRPATSGRLAIKGAQRQLPDLILLDISMPEMDGYETCERIKQDQQLKDIPIIFISALSDTLDKVKAFSCGGVDYVTKPFQAEEVLARVSVHLSLRRSNLKLEHVLEELKAAQANMIQSEKMASLGVLTAGIAHEINNPVGFIGMSATGLAKALRTVLKIVEQYSYVTSENTDQQLPLLKGQMADVEFPILVNGIWEMLDNIDIGVKRTSEIVKGLRDFSHPEGGGKKLTDIHKSIDTALIMLTARTKDKVEIIREYGDIPRIEVFPVKMGQVFLNLLNNAIDAVIENDSDCDASISISTSCREYLKRSWICINIKDTGVGLSDEVLKHIFVPFFTTKDVGMGSGLGLSISHGIIADHDGRIEVKNDLICGTVFRVWLPIKT